METRNYAVRRGALLSATGVLIALEQQGAGYAVRVRFATHKGQPVEFTSLATAKNERREVGDYVGVVYDPETPGSAMLE